MKRFECGNLVPGCDWHTQAADEAEVIRHAATHLKEVHERTNIRPNLIDEIKARITDSANA